MQARALVLVVLLASCAHHAPRATFASDDLYAQVAQFADDEGVAVIMRTSTRHPVKVRLDQVLETPDHQQYQVRTLVVHCAGPKETNGGDEESNECLLAQMRGLTFSVHDEARLLPPSGPAVEKPDTSSWRTKLVIASVAIIGPLTYGGIVCKFQGCGVIFGLPAVLLAFIDLIAFTGLG